MHFKHEPPRDALTWEGGHKKWLGFPQGEFSEGHVNASIVCLRQWHETFGKDSIIEGTTLAQYSRRIDEKAIPAQDPPYILVGPALPERTFHLLP